MTAYVLRFINLLRKRTSINNGLELTASGVKAAETLWIKDVQSATCSKDLECLLTPNCTLTPYVKQFNLFLDEQSVIRCKGRLDNSELDGACKTPILLPSRHRLTELIIQDCHERVLHSGLSTTLATTRERFWIVKGRQTVKRILKSCVICRKLEGTSYKSPQAPWWGGFWERMVQSAKRSLRKSIGRTTLTYDQLNTLLTEIETVINARPPTYLNDDQDGTSFTLSPSHLINGRRITNTPNSAHFDVVSTYQTRVFNQIRYTNIRSPGVYFPG